MEAKSREEGSECRYMMEGAVVRADCVVKIHENVIRPAVTSLKTERNQAGVPAAPGGMRGHS